MVKQPCVSNVSNETREIVPSSNYAGKNITCISVRDGEKYKACRDKYSPASDNMKLMSKVAARINRFPFFMLILSLILSEMKREFYQD